ncbi:MAG: DMT family transporter, partial [Algoriphagus sp.]
EPLVNRTKVKWYEVVLGVIVISGLLVIFQFESGYWLGLSVALVSAFLAALFSVLNGRLSQRHSPYQITFYEMLAACLFALLMLPFYTGLMTQENSIQWMWTDWDWLWLLILGLVCTVYPFSVTVELMKRLPVFSINLTMNLEPVYGILLAVMILGESEKMTTQFYIGTLIILLSVLIYPVLNFWNKRRKAVRTLG